MRSHSSRALICLTGIAFSFVPASRRAQGYTITTVVGGGPAAYDTGNGGPGPAASARLGSPAGLALDAVGNLYIADQQNGLVREVNANGIISTVAGGNASAFLGDGGAATSAGLSSPTGVAVDAGGNLYIADLFSYRIRKVDLNGIINTVAGGGSLASLLGGCVSMGVKSALDCVGDGGPALNAILGGPQAVAVDSTGNLYIADTGSARVREVTTDGNISTAVGCGFFSCASLGGGDGGPATKARLVPVGVAVDGSGNIYIADAFYNSIRMVAPSGTITTVAGSGTGSYSGDGGPATKAGLNQPQAVAIDTAGNLYIADTGDSRIRMVTPDGTITTIAGNGSGGYSGDGGPATSAQMYAPSGIAVGQSGIIYFADKTSGVVRMLTPAGSTN
jgi:trimeric autotransporter adhesin